MQARLGERGEAFRVVGVLASGGDEDEQAFAPLAALQRLGGQPDRFSRRAGPSSTLHSRPMKKSWPSLLRPRIL